MDMEFKHIYRMTHIENIPHILRYGITHHSSSNANPHYIPIGDASLIKFRTEKNITINDTKTIILGDYIPFYFGVRMPMLYVIQRGGNCVAHATKPEDIVYIAISIQDIANDPRMEYYFSDGHATNALTSFFSKDDIYRLSKLIDKDAILATQWSGDTIDRDLKRRKEAEFLIKNDIPAEYIFGFVCYNNYAKNKLLRWGIPENIIRVSPKSYY